MVELFTLIFGDIQTWFYMLGICWMVGLPFIWIWKKYLMHKKDKDKE